MESNINKEDEVLYTKLEFCKLHKISVPTFDRMMKNGYGPKVIKFQGKKAKVLITKEAAAEWRKNMER